MTKAIVDISGAGPHDVVPAQAGLRIIVDYMFLTFSHEQSRAQMVKLMTGSTVFMSSYVLDGGELEYSRRTDDRTFIQLGAPFKVEMTADLKATGTIEYSIGAQ